MATGARSPKPDPTSAQVAAIMREAKHMGHSFDQAWTWVEQSVTFPPAWRNPAPEEESVVSFTHRHYLAAWHDLEAGHFCEHEGCLELLDPELRFCLVHMAELVLVDFRVDATQAA